MNKLDVEQNDKGWMFAICCFLEIFPICLGIMPRHLQIKFWPQVGVWVRGGSLTIFKKTSYSLPANPLSLVTKFRVEKIENWTALGWISLRNPFCLKEEYYFDHMIGRNY